MNKTLKSILIFAAFSLVIMLMYQFSPFKDTEDNSAKLSSEELVVEASVEKKEMFGLVVDSFQVEEKVVQNGESFGNILLGYGIGYDVVNTIATEFKDIFDVRKLRSGKPYAVFCEEKDSSKIARYLVYESSLVDYYVFDLHKNVNVYHGKKEVTVKEREISGVISSSLYETLAEQGASAELTMGLSDIYAWSVDFFHIQKGDYIKLIFEEKYIDDTVRVGVGRILASEFYHQGEAYYSFYYEKDDYSDYFDEEGRTLRKAFLKAPLNYFRISSSYNPKRFHPVLKRWKAHLGTDYAAPHGTPIMATANGEVIAAAYTRGNGNYVKIKHNATYTTQYLHMSKFAQGIKKGKHVKQGDVIGYVGSTGLATGPHVCYRFWKNGVQVDPYKQDLPDAEPIKEEYKEDYLEYLKVWKARLDKINMPVKTESPDVLMASTK